MNDFFKLCPNCKEKQFYSTKYVLKNAIEYNTLCKKCNGKNQQVFCEDVKNINGDWYKNCIICNKLIVYCSKNSAMKHKNIKCNSCARFGTKRSQETRKKLSDGKIGKKNPRFGKSSPMKGKHHTEETKYKLRIATIKDLQNKKLLPSQKNYNPRACKFINKLNEEKGWKLQHAENGGEIQLYGYFVDGYDKEKNIIVEYDEPKHRSPYRKQKDLIRQNRIIQNINPNMFIRYDEIENKLYDVISGKEIV